jgi:hypothetical protein
MADELKTIHDSSVATVKHRLLNGAGQHYNSDSEEFEDYNVSNLADYRLATTEKTVGAGLSWYVTSFPSAITTPGVYYFFGEETSVPDALSDPSPIVWNGAAEMFPAEGGPVESYNKDTMPNSAIIATVTAGVGLDSANKPYSHNGTAQAGSTSQITLQSSASAVDNYYKNAQLFAVGGAGANQASAIIDSYNGTTKVAIFREAVSTAFDNTTQYQILKNSQLASESTSDYQGTISLTIDDTNSQDEYSVIWYLRTAPITSGITLPTIQVIKWDDGTDLIASTAMTQIGSTGAYKYAATTTARITRGSPYLIKMTATIDGEVRTAEKFLGRDSS